MDPSLDPEPHQTSMGSILGQHPSSIRVSWKSFSSNKHPFLFPPRCHRHHPFLPYGNYKGTHYFFALLGAFLRDYVPMVQGSAVDHCQPSVTALMWVSSNTQWCIICICHYNNGSEHNIIIMYMFATFKIITTT